MAVQIITHPDLPIPRVLPFLTNAIISLGGCRTEGIFRVPGDGERVNGTFLKNQFIFRIKM